MTTKKEPSFERRLTRAETALRIGRSVDLSAYDPAAIQEAREKALDEALPRVQALIAGAYEEVKALKLTDEERVARLEWARRG